MKIAGIFNHDEQRVGNRLSGMKTYIVREQENIKSILEEIESDKSIRYSCV